MGETEGEKERERYCFKNKIMHRKRPRSFSHLLKGHSFIKDSCRRELSNLIRTTFGEVDI